jgi:hypothetical protein
MCYWNLEFKMANLIRLIMIDLVLLKENPELAKSIKIETSLADLLVFGESIHRTATKVAKGETSDAVEFLRSLDILPVMVKDGYCFSIWCLFLGS